MLWRITSIRSESENPGKEAESDCFKNDNEFWKIVEVLYSKIIQTLQYDLKKKVNVYKKVI